MTAKCYVRQKRLTFFSGVIAISSGAMPLSVFIRLGCPVLSDSVKGCSIKKNSHKSQFQFRRIIILKISSIKFKIKTLLLTLKPMKSPVVLSTTYILLNFLYGSITWFRYVLNFSICSPLGSLENPETISPVHGLKILQIQILQIYINGLKLKTSCRSLNWQWKFCYN